MPIRKKTEKFEGVSFQTEDNTSYSLIMDSTAIAAAIPFFFMLIGLEYLIARARNLKVFRFEDAISSLSCGISQQMVGIFLKVALGAGYVWVYENFRFATIEMNSWAAWFGIMILVDLAYFFFHWASHRVNFIWATHVVHHQSEEYNLSTALRQSIFQGLMSAPFYLPLALLGFPPLMLLLTITVNTLYQFWIHTQLIRSLGPLEWVLNTPSHHRVHHGIDPQYIDKNFAGMLIIWDRLFGTFQQERGPIHYGTVKPLKSWNPLWANTAGWVEILKLSSAARSLREKLYAWIAPPEWRPASLGGSLTIARVPASRLKYSSNPYRGVSLYIAGQFIVVSTVVVLMLLLQDTLPRSSALFIVSWILASLLAWSALSEHRAWGVALEFVRQGTFLLVTTLLLPAEIAAPVPQLVSALFAGLSLYALHEILKRQK